MAETGERRVARAGTLNRDEIADAALRLFAEEGLAGLSMRRLGNELGVHYSTLYWHVTDKRELLRLVLDAVLAGVSIPEEPAGGQPANWRGELAELFTSLRAALAAHPGAATLLIDLVPGSHGLAVTERALHLLRGTGMNEQQAIWAYVALKQYTAASAQRDIATTTDRMAVATEELGQLPADRYPNVLAVGARLFGADDEEGFRFGLRCLLDGIAAAT